MKRKLLMLALCAALALCALPMAVSAEGNVAKIGDKEYATLQAAVDAVPADNTQTTITLLGNASGDGVQVKDGQNIIFDLASYTYNIDGTTVGSPSTETNGFQLLKGSTVAFQNGTITSNKAKILIQNYCNLTLTDVNLDGKGLVNGANSYVLSNNNGSVQLIGNTSITAPDGGVAFDMYYWPSNGYTDGVKVTVNTTGSINGKIEYGCDSTGVDNVAEKAILNIQNGTFNGSLSTSLTDTGITVVGGSFSDTSFIDYCEDGKTLVKDPDTNMFVPQSKPVVATVNGKDYYSLAEAATAAAGTSDKTLTLKADATLDSMLTINTEGMVIDLNGFTITASGNFPKDADKNNNHLVDITADNVTLKNGTLKAGSSNNHTLNVWNAQGVQLAGLTLDNAATYEGAPLIVGASDVTVNGPLKVVTGANSWYGINLDDRYGETELTFDNEAEITFTDVFSNELLWCDDSQSQITVNNPEVAGLVYSETVGQYLIISATIDSTGYATLQDAVNAASASDTITLTRDAVVYNTITVDKDLTIDGAGSRLIASESAGAFPGEARAVQQHLMQITNGAKVNLKGVQLLAGSLHTAVLFAGPPGAGARGRA